MFTDTPEAAGVEHRFIRPGRPQTDGQAEQVHNKNVRELWHLTFATRSDSSISSLRHDLTDNLEWSNNKWPNTGRWNQGELPIAIIEPNAGNCPRHRLPPTKHGMRGKGDRSEPGG